ncbi:hypothetical protein [Paenibacillus gansuensis]|uniref:Uncharacterized protein n=1 Tax=Paenibacillus gansuensis TaxID=306542 RepID=A0ABW5PLZ2_9BACL
MANKNDSKAQQEQARENSKKVTQTVQPGDAGYDKKLDGENRPSV